MKDEAWLKKIQEQLEDYSAPLPSSGWERLAQALPRHKTIRLRRWQMAVAASLVGALSCIGLYLLQDEHPEEHSRMHGSSIPAIADAMPASTRADQQLPGTPQLLNLPHTPITANIKKDTSVVCQTVSEEKREVGTWENTATASQEHTSPTPTKERRTVGTPHESDVLLAMTEQPHKRTRGWSVGLSIGNAGGLSALSDNDELHPLRQNAPGTNYLNLNLATTSNKVIDIPQNQKIVFQNGLPYLQNRTRQVISAKHKQPISIGFSLRKNLPKGFSVETGLVYTYLASDILYEGEVEETNQKLHYLGIPIRANWNFIDTKRFTLYVSTGGTIEKCIYGKTGNKTTVVDPLQFSILASVGVQYNIGKHIGIYVEPGFSYYFDDGTDILTIRKDNPCNFTLQAGLRLSY